MSAFVGRTDERRTLEALIARAEEGAVAGLVFGDPGSGKTRLLAETVERAGVENTARIVGYEPERNVPLSASAEFLHVLASSPAGRRLNALVFEPERSRRSRAARRSGSKLSSGRPEPSSTPPNS